MKILKVAATAAVLVTLVTARAQTLKEIEHTEQSEKTVEMLKDAMKTIEDLESKIGKFTAARNTSCLKAVGSKLFCTCLGDALPWVFSFEDYVSITTKSRAENQYSKMEPDMREAYDKVPAIRDKCVASSFKS